MPEPTDTAANTAVPQQETGSRLPNILSWALLFAGAAAIIYGHAFRSGWLAATLALAGMAALYTSGYLDRVRLERKRLERRR